MRRHNLTNDHVLTDISGIFSCYIFASDSIFPLSKIFADVIVAVNDIIAVYHSHCVEICA